MIYSGSTPVAGVYLGDRPVSAVYRGSSKIWPPDTPGEPTPPTYAFYDDFERATIGSDWQGSGGVIDNGALKKSTTAGNADYWTTRQFDTDDLDVTVTLGPIGDRQQPISVLLGSSAQYIYVEFSQSSGVLGAYDGSTWNILHDYGAISWAEGDTLRVIRSGTTVTMYRNGAEVSTVTTSVALGTAFRRVGLTVRMAENFFTKWYGPTVDAIGVNPD